MSSQVDGMRKLADSLMSSAEVVLAAEKILHLEAAAAAGVRVADFAQMSADTDEAIAEFGAIRTEGADLLRKAMQTIQNIRRGEATNVPAEKPTRKPREASAPVEPAAEVAPAVPAAEVAPAEPVAESGGDPDRRPTPTEIFAFIANNPDGASLMDMEAHFGTPRIVLQRPVKQMLEVDHEIVRDDVTGRYFAI